MTSIEKILFEALQEGRPIDIGRGNGLIVDKWYMLQKQKLAITTLNGYHGSDKTLGHIQAVLKKFEEEFDNNWVKGQDNE